MPDIQTEDGQPIPFVSRSRVEAEQTTSKPKPSTAKEKAKELKDSVALPPPPGEKVGFDAMLKWFKLLTPEMQVNNRIMLYVYRLYPSIIRQKIDPTADNNIDIIIDGFDTLNENYFVERFGGGKYRLMIADQGAQKRQFGGYFEAVLEIPISVHSPKVDMREVDWNNKVNKGFAAWARAQRLIDENNNPMTPNAAPQQVGGGNDTVQLMKLFMDFMGKMTTEQESKVRRALGEADNDKGVREILLERMKQDDPNKQLTALTTVMAAMKSMQPSGDNGLASIIPLFVQMMQQQAESANKQFMMMMEMMKSNKSEGGESRDSISQLKDLVEVARELKGGNSGTSSPKSTVAEVIEAVAPVLGPAFNMVSNFLALRGTQQGQQPMAQQPTVVAQPASAPTPSSAPSNVVSAQEFAVQQAKLAGQQQPNGAPNPMITQNEATQAIQQFGSIIINKLGAEGWEFGAWIAEGFGDPIAAKLANMGPENLLNAAKTVPEFWNQITSTYGEDYLKKWLVSFCNYKEEMKAAEGEE